MTKVSVGEFVGEGEGKSKKISKKNAAIAVLEELKKLPPLPVAERVRPRIKKKTKPPGRVSTYPQVAGRLEGGEVLCSSAFGLRSARERSQPSS